jgi:ribosomal protein L37E
MASFTCQNCNTTAYDDTALFCHACGAPLPVSGKEKKNTGYSGTGMKLARKGSAGTRDDVLKRQKRGPVNNRVTPVEICARCGEPVTDSSRIYCPTCSAFVREVPLKEEPLLIHTPFEKSLREKPVIIPDLHQNTGTKTLQEQEPVQVQAAGTRVHQKAAGRKLIIIIAGIALLLIMLVLVIILMLTFWVSLY